jgi:hypothetical protein
MRLTFVVAALAVAISGCGADPKESFEELTQIMEESYQEASEGTDHISMSPIQYDVKKTISEVAPYAGSMNFNIKSENPGTGEYGMCQNIYRFAFIDGEWKPAGVKYDPTGESSYAIDIAIDISSSTGKKFSEKTGIE